MDSWYLVFAFLLVLANGFFVAAEFAIVKVRSTQITELAEHGSVRAKMARKLIRHLDAYLSATQLGITLASLALGWIGEPAFHHLIQPLFTRFQVSEAYARSISATVAPTRATIQCSAGSGSGYVTTYKNFHRASAHPFRPRSLAGDPGSSGEYHHSLHRRPL